MYKTYGKLILDYLIAFTSVLVLIPVLLIISILIRLDSKGPILFRQKRIGLNKQAFYIYKFRTMSIDTPQNTPTNELNDPQNYITRIGSFLRKTSLDELPQLFNILKGEMSLVGPRPALWNQEDLITERELYKVHTVRPGVTGWAQVNGRDELPIQVKAELDGEYIKQMNFFFDINCIFKTIICVLKRDGVMEGRYIHTEKHKIDS